MQPRADSGARTVRDRSFRSVTFDRASAVAGVSVLLLSWSPADAMPSDMIGKGFRPTRGVTSIRLLSLVRANTLGMVAAAATKDALVTLQLGLTGPRLIEHIQNDLNLPSLYGEDLSRLRGLNVADIGTGTVELARFLAETTGVRSARQLDWYYQRWVGYFTAPVSMLAYRRFIRNNREYLVRGTAEALPFDDASLDLVTSHQLVSYLHDTGRLSAFLRETLRVLKTGGRAILLPFAVSQEADQRADVAAAVEGAATLDWQLLSQLGDREGSYLDNYRAVLTKQEVSPPGH